MATGLGSCGKWVGRAAAGLAAETVTLLHPRPVLDRGVCGGGGWQGEASMLIPPGEAVQGTERPPGHARRDLEL